jgi:outer membrane murein-binding lipoprotein Lpp
MDISLLVELALAALLGVTVIYCALLERKLKVLRSDQDGLKTTIVELSNAISAAGASMRALKSAAAEASQTLETQISRARGLIDELALVNASGERLATRIEGGITGATSRAPGFAQPQVLASRLESLRPKNSRSDVLRNMR